jgi:hypothetical protein
MTELATIANLPDVKSAVLGDLAGGYLDSVREPDGETVAAVMGFVATLLARAGDELGLGALRRISAASDSQACLVVVEGEAVITASVAPARSLPIVEKALDAAVQAEV